MYICYFTCLCCTHALARRCAIFPFHARGRMNSSARGNHSLVNDDEVVAILLPSEGHVQARPGKRKMIMRLYMCIYMHIYIYIQT